MDIQNLLGFTGNQQKLTSALRNEDTDTTTTPTTTSSSSTTGEEFNTFLTLLTAQIRNQDPLAPLDSTQFVEQLATFSQLELQAKGNNVLENIASMLAQNLYAQNNTSPTP